MLAFTTSVAPTSLKIDHFEDTNALGTPVDPGALAPQFTVFVNVTNCGSGVLLVALYDSQGNLAGVPAQLAAVAADGSRSFAFNVATLTLNQFYVQAAYTSLLKDGAKDFTMITINNTLSPVVGGS
jgi:hypothetical protein